MQVVKPLLSPESLGFGAKMTLERVITESSEISNIGVIPSGAAKYVVLEGINGVPIGFL